ncbi:MAG: hypothetical protein Q8Q01_03580 [archaeon]|nr:hypothetical protein [archaeon]
MRKKFNALLIATLVAITPGTTSSQNVEQQNEDPLEDIIINDLKKNSTVCLLRHSVYFSEGKALIQSKSFTGLVTDYDNLGRAYVLTSTPTPNKRMPTLFGREVLDLAEITYFAFDRNDKIPLEVVEEKGNVTMLRTRSGLNIKDHKIGYKVEPSIVLQDAASPLVILKLMEPDLVYAPACERSGLRKEKPVDGLITNRGYDKDHFEVTFQKRVASTTGGPVFIVRPDGIYLGGLLEEQSKDGKGVVINIKGFYNLITTK